MKTIILIISLLIHASSFASDFFKYSTLTLTIKPDSESMTDDQSETEYIDAPYFTEINKPVTNKINKYFFNECKINLENKTIQSKNPDEICLIYDSYTIIINNEKLLGIAQGTQSPTNIYFDSQSGDVIDWKKVFNDKGISEIKKSIVMKATQPERDLVFEALDKYDRTVHLDEVKFPSSKYFYGKKETTIEMNAFSSVSEHLVNINAYLNNFKDLDLDVEINNDLDTVKFKYNTYKIKPILDFSTPSTEDIDADYDPEEHDTQEISFRIKDIKIYLTDYGKQILLR